MALYKEAEDVVLAVQAPGFFDTSLAAIVKVLVERFVGKYAEYSLFGLLS